MNTIQFSSGVDLIDTEKEGTKEEKEMETDQKEDTNGIWIHTQRVRVDDG